MNTKPVVKRHLSIKPSSKTTIRSSSIIVEGTNNHLYSKHDKTKCKHCLNQKKTLEAQKSMKIKIQTTKLPKILMKSTHEHYLPLKRTPQKKTSFVGKFNEGILANRTPEKIASPSIKETGLEEPNLELKSRKHPDIDFLFDPQRDCKVPYHLDGNSKMYLADVIAKREALKDDEDIKKAILDFMQLYNFKNYSVSKYEYIQTHLKIACLLRPDLKEQHNHEDLKKIIELDWRHDTKGSDEMTRSNLEKALFEMADIWTTGVEKEEYISFFNVLKLKFVFEEETNQKLFAELYQA